MKLEAKIEKAIQACKLAELEPGASGYLPDVIASLEAMLEVVRSGGEPLKKRRRRTGGLFWIVSDDEDLLTSPLGEQLVDLMNEYRT